MIPTVGLSIPMLIRGIFNLLCNIDAIDDWTDDHNLVFIPLMFFVGELIPNCFQLSSLVFGYLRTREKKSKLEVGAPKEGYHNDDNEIFSSNSMSNSQQLNSSASLNNFATYKVRFFDPPLLQYSMRQRSINADETLSSSRMKK